MRVRVFVEPQQGARYADILAAARTAERCGFDGFFRSDHFLRMGTAVSGDPGPTDAWTTLAGLARETSRIRIGTLVSSATFRHPGILAVQAAQVDEMSGGRVEVGLGTGWFRPEHAALGIPFPARRFDQLEEQLEIVTGLWSCPVGSTFSFDGEHFRISDSPALPKPVQTPMPVIVGGSGPVRTPQLAARFATEFNLSFPPLDQVAAGLGRVDAACERIGRDPGSIGHSLAVVGLVGADEAEFRRRAREIGRDPAELRRTSVAGVPAEVRDRAEALAADGVETLYLQIWNLHDLDHLELLARTLIAPSPEG